MNPAFRTQNSSSVSPLPPPQGTSPTLKGSSDILPPEIPQDTSVSPENPENDTSILPVTDSAPQTSPDSPPNPAAPRSELAAARRVTVFFLFLVLSLVGFHQLIQFGMRRIETGGFGVTNRIVSDQVNAEIVISGSSRAFTHYDPRIIEEITGRSAFNIGRNGSQTDMQVAVLKTYLQHNAPPKLVVHNLDSFSFVTTKEIYDPAQYLPYMNEAPIYEAVRKITPHAWKWKWFPLYGYAVEDMRFSWTLGLRRLVGEQPKEDHFLGYQPRQTSWTGEFEDFRRSNPDGVRFEIEEQGIRDIQEVVKVCRSRGIPLLFVYSPVYYEMQEIETSREDVFRLFEEIARNFDVPVWDFSTSLISRNRENFYNSQHLNAVGAAAFSNEFATRLKAEQKL